jgi:hypothetical protein
MTTKANAEEFRTAYPLQLMQLSTVLHDAYLKFKKKGTERHSFPQKPATSLENDNSELIKRALIPQLYKYKRSEVTPNFDKAVENLLKIKEEGALDANALKIVQQLVSDYVNELLPDISIESYRGISWPCFSNSTNFVINNLTWGALATNNARSTDFIKSCGVEINAEYVLLKPQGKIGNDLGEMSKNNTPRIRIITITKVEGYSNPIVTDCPNFSAQGAVITGTGSGGGGGEVHGEKSGIFLVYNFLNMQNIAKSLAIETWVYKGESADQNIANNICRGCQQLFCQVADKLGYSKWKPYDALRGQSRPLDQVFKEWASR